MGSRFRTAARILFGLLVVAASSPMVTSMWLRGGLEQEWVSVGVLLVGVLAAGWAFRGTSRAVLASASGHLLLVPNLFVRDAAPWALLYSLETYPVLAFAGWVGMFRRDNVAVRWMAAVLPTACLALVLGLWATR